ncbi:unnamed protein product [marine sediment metagenome]|uniref:Uncharacterized protein n=1 Tax=marine sediment metagenome TaxID=412755 RepID=X1BUJ8_9ZZZZ
MGMLGIIVGSPTSPVTFPTLIKGPWEDKNIIAINSNYKATIFFAENGELYSTGDTVCDIKSDKLSYQQRKASLSDFPKPLCNIFTIVNARTFEAGSHSITQTIEQKEEDGDETRVIKRESKAWVGGFNT